MPVYVREPEDRGARRQRALAMLFLILAFTTLYLPEGGQQTLAWTVRATLLRPFLTFQEGVAAARLRARQVEDLQARLDSLSAVVATQGALFDENRTLRSLLGLARRVGTTFRPASVLRPGTPGSESIFLLDVGSDDGVVQGAPVVDAYGLVGVVREARSHLSVGMDWTHPDFRVSAMLANGGDFGLVENRRGVFRGADRLVLNGMAYHESVEDGTAVLTSGLGGVYPRGIPIGRVTGVAETQAGWLKSYWLKPMVQPGSVTHVLVEVGSEVSDLSDAWPVDSIRTRDDVLDRERAEADSLAALTDSVRVLRARLRQLRRAAGDSAPSDSPRAPVGESR
ncbi:MAG: rod shape-determining protein MreC [Gemmatimonadetes bacterium]|nr:rod shape-determining protein MreC [Gemmatimonadota bacterium]